MKPEELISQAKRIKENFYTSSPVGSLAEAKEFLRVYAGEKSSFYIHLNEVKQGSTHEIIHKYVSGILDAFISYIKNGLYSGVSIQRQAQIDVVSDYLAQAENLLESNHVHPAAPTVLIGASLEEFLRNWVEEKNIDLKEKNLASNHSVKY